MPRNTCGRGAAYTSTEKRSLVTNIGIGLLKSVSEGHWERVYSMHLSVYEHKNQTVEFLM
eukprot:13771106-Ditylum_brightwellii.AAC.1